MCAQELVGAVTEAKAPALGEGLILGIRGKSVATELLLRRLGLGVLAAEALDSAGGVDQLLLAGEEGMAVRADFYADVAFMGRAGRECITARAVHTYFAITRMNGCFHVDSNLDSNHLILSDFHRIQQPSAVGVGPQVSGGGSWG